MKIKIRTRTRERTGRARGKEIYVNALSSFSLSRLLPNAPAPCTRKSKKVDTESKVRVEETMRAESPVGTDVQVQIKGNKKKNAKMRQSPIPPWTKETLIKTSDCRQ